MTRLKGKARAKASNKKRNKQKNDFFIRRKNLIGLIRKYDDPALAMICEDVAQGDAINIKKVFKKMEQVLNVTKNGVGLAASQIGIPAKMIIIKPDADSSKVTCMINPEIISYSEKMRYGVEMCLSYPEVRGMVERYVWVEVEYYDEEWKKRKVKYEEGNILSIIVQHELDHILGICQVGEWWKDPEGMQKKLEERFKPKEEDTGSEMVESEDLKKEKAEAKKERAVEVTEKALEENNFVDENGNDA